jgi:diaminopimelate decarboxylase
MSIPSLKPDHRQMLKSAMERLDSSFYYYDLDKLEEHLTSMRDNKDPDLKLWYACKANPLSAILKLLRNLDFGLDVASKGELDQVLSSGILPKNILSTGPSKSRRYLKQLLLADVDVIVLESINQAYWLNSIAENLQKNPKVLLRVQLEWEEGKSVLGGNDITPFGIEPDQWKKMEPDKVSSLDIVGFHVFQWGNILEVDRLKKIWWKIAEKCNELSKDLGVPLQILDLGGGLGIPYTEDEPSVSWKEINNVLTEVKEKFNLSKIWMELGRYAVGESGMYFTQVIDRKSVRGIELLVTDGGINHMARPALTGQPFPCELFRKSKAKTSRFYVHGPLCTGLDKLGDFDLPNDIGPGDWLCFKQAGAYGFTESMPYFLCHNLPAEVVIYKGNMMCPRPIRQSAEWLL